MGNGLCVDACESLGDVGGLVFTLVAVAWGLWQRYLRSQAVVEAVMQRQAKDEAVRALSMRPPMFVSLPVVEFPRPAKVPESSAQEGASSTDGEAPNDGG